MIPAGRIVAQALKAEGIDHVFTLCGGHVQMIYDGCLDEGIRVVDVRHEQTAGHAADGYARVTGKPGCAIVTAGPGLTDTVTAVANAQRAQVPMLCIGGQGPFNMKGKGSLQEMDHVGLMQTITKWSETVPESRRVGEYVRNAWRIAMSGVPGPVFLEMPLDILVGWVKEKDITGHEHYRSAARPAADPMDIEAAAALIDAAERPMLIVGSQIRWTRRPEALAAFLDRCPMPTFLNGMARTALDWDHPCRFSQVRKKALGKADVILVFGTPFDFRLGYGEQGWNPDAKVIQVDLDGEVLASNRDVHVGIQGDTGSVLFQLEQAVARRDAGEWIAEIRELEEKKIAPTLAERASDADPINPLRACAELDAVLPDDAIVVGDGGDFVATAAYNLHLTTRNLWMDPGPLGTLGVGPGFAMAAKLAHPDRPVCIVYGDGSFGLHAMEFEAMVRQGIPVVAVIGNDAAWTQIRRGQVMMYGQERAVATELAMTRYDKVVEAVGGRGWFVEHPDQIRPALEEAFGCGEVACVNIAIGTSDFRKYAISV